MGPEVTTIKASMRSEGKEPALEQVCVTHTRCRQTCKGQHHQSQLPKQKDNAPPEQGEITSMLVRNYLQAYCKYLHIIFL